MLDEAEAVTYSTDREEAKSDGTSENRADVDRGYEKGRFAANQISKFALWMICFYH